MGSAATSSLMPRIAFATYRAEPELDPDDRPVAAALRQGGVEVVPVVWDDPSVEWSAFDAVVIRSTWDYHLRPAEYEAWVRRFTVVLAAVDERASFVSVEANPTRERGNRRPSLARRVGFRHKRRSPAVDCARRWRRARRAVAGDGAGDHGAEPLSGAGRRSGRSIRGGDSASDPLRAACGFARPRPCEAASGCWPSF